MTNIQGSRQHSQYSKLEFVSVNLLGAEFQNFESFGARFPPMERLELVQYEWEHSESEIEKIWDFSRLRSLTMKQDIGQFLFSPPLRHLQHLEYLEIEDIFSYGPSFDEIERTRLGLGRLLGELKHLNTFKMSAYQWEQLVPMQAVVGIENRLRSLRLRSFSSCRSGMLQVSMLTNLQRACPGLEDLDLNISLVNPAVSFSNSGHNNGARYDGKSMNSSNPRY